jgi:hypothetical protein
MEKPFEESIRCPKACDDAHGCTFRARVSWEEYQTTAGGKCWVYARNLVVELRPPEGGEKCKPFLYGLNPEYRFKHEKTSDEDKKEYDAQKFSLVVEPGSKTVTVDPEALSRQIEQDSKPQPAGTVNPPWDYQSWDDSFKKARDKTTGSVFRLSTSPGVGLSAFTVRLAAIGLCGCVGRTKDLPDVNQVNGRDVKIECRFEKKPC